MKFTWVGSPAVEFSVSVRPAIRYHCPLASVLPAVVLQAEISPSTLHRRGYLPRLVDCCCSLPIWWFFTDPPQWVCFFCMEGDVRFGWSNFSTHSSPLAIFLMSYFRFSVSCSFFESRTGSPLPPPPPLLHFYVTHLKCQERRLNFRVNKPLLDQRWLMGKTETTLAVHSYLSLKVGEGRR